MPSWSHCLKCCLSENISPILGTVPTFPTKGLYVWLKLPYNYTSINSRKCEVAIRGGGHSLNSYALKWLIVGKAVLSELDGSPGSFQCDGKAFIRVAL